MRGERRLAPGERLLYVAEPVRPLGQGEMGEPGYSLLLGQVYRPVRLTLTICCPGCCGRAL
jgi:hypothetical protein